MSFYLMHRGWFDNEVFGNPEREPLCKRAAWVWMIDHAEYAAKQVRIGRTLVTLRRGQLAYSLRFLGKAWGWHYLRVRRFLADLAARNMIETACETARETGQSVLTICNYERYQAPTHEARNSSRDRLRRKSVTNYKEKEGNQEYKERDSKNLREDLGRCAPAREGAHEAEAPEEPTQPPVVEAPPEPVESPRPPPQSPAPDDVELDPEPPLTPEERADRVRQLDEVIAALNRRGLPDGAVIDPDAYQRSVEERKWSNWLNGLHGFASQRFDSEVRMRAWEAIDCARTAGSRERTPRQVRDILNQISSLRGAEQRVAA